MEDNVSIAVLARYCVCPQFLHKEHLVCELWHHTWEEKQHFHVLSLGLNSFISRNCLLLSSTDSEVEGLTKRVNIRLFRRDYHTSKLVCKRRKLCLQACRIIHIILLVLVVKFTIIQTCMGMKTPVNV